MGSTHIIMKLILSLASVLLAVAAVHAFFIDGLDVPDNGDKLLFVCNGDALNMNCDGGKKINILMINYGTHTNVSCPNSAGKVFNDNLILITITAWTRFIWLAPTRLAVPWTPPLDCSPV